MLHGGKTTRLRSWRLAAAAFLLCFTDSPFLLALGQTGGALKFDDFGDLKTDDILARLDLFAQRLGKEEGLKGYIVAYRREDQLPGSFLRYVHGFRGYLVNKRGIEPARVSIIEAGTGEKMVTELWLVPKGSIPPQKPAANLQLNAAVQFDGLTLGVGCVGEFTLELQKPSDALRFFGGALRSIPAAKGFIIVHPSARGSLIKAQKLTEIRRQSLVKEYGITAGRVVTSLGRPRPCREIDLWLAPSSLIVPKESNIELLSQSQLIAEAEQNKYTIRRLEFIGNEHIRDQVVRRRLWALQEGEIFTKKALTKGLLSLNRPADIQLVRLDDVDVRLDRKEKIVDLRIVINERRRQL